MLSALQVRGRAHPWFTVLSLGFAVGAVFHLAGVLHPAWAGGDPPWRHGVFVAVNTAAAVGVWHRPRWLPWPFAVLCAQQVWSHGGVALTAWRTAHRVDWPSALVLVVLPLTLLALVRDRRREYLTASTPDAN